MELREHDENTAKWPLIISASNMFSEQIPVSEAHLKPSQASTIKLFFKNSGRLKTLNYFRKKASS